MLLSVKWWLKHALPLSAMLLMSCTTAVKTSPSQGKVIKPPRQTSYPVIKPTQPTKQPIKLSTEIPIDFNRGITSTDYFDWLHQYEYRKQRVAEYERFLRQQVGYVPPMDQMLRSARSWKKCGFEPYEVPPENYWVEMVNTLKLVKRLKDEGYLPEPFKLVSVYRNPELNRCANGSKGSKHLMNAAVDIRIDYINKSHRDDTEYALCEFWNTQGEFFNFGLGLYRSGTVHVDTQGYRRWGSSYGSASSPCHD